MTHLPAPGAALSLGRAFLGAATLGSGLLQLATGEFVRLVPKLPAAIPAQGALALASGVVLVALGLALLSGRRIGAAATVLAGLLLLVVAFLYAPSLVATEGMDRPYLRGFMWTNPLKSLALAGGAALLAARFPEGAAARLAPLGPALLAAFLIVCGVQHFVYHDFVVTLVPEWLPARGLWASFTGVALMAGGAGLLVPRVDRLAAYLSAAMIFAWVWLLHVPRAVAGPAHANETAGVFEALAISGVALLVAADRATSSAPGGPRAA